MFDVCIKAYNKSRLGVNAYPLGERIVSTIIKIYFEGMVAMDQAQGSR